MSKTLFNTNTFNNKNVKNSDDVADLKVTTFKATNAILTNITNTELQAATTGVSNNATAISNNTSSISGKQDALTEGDGITISGSNVISFDGGIGSTSISTSGDVTAGNLIYSDSDGGLAVLTNVKTKIATKQDTLTFNAPSSNNSNPSTSAQIKTALDLKNDVLTFNAPSSDNSNPSTSAQIKAALDLKNDSITAGSGLLKLGLASGGDQLSFVGGDVGSSSITTTGDITCADLTTTGDVEFGSGDITTGVNYGSFSQLRVKRSGSGLPRLYLADSTGDIANVSLYTDGLKTTGTANIASHTNGLYLGADEPIDYTAIGYLKWYGASSSNSSINVWRFSWGSNQPNSKVEFRNLSSDNKCRIYAQSYTNLSDDRGKINETVIENATETINKLRPVLYDEYGFTDYGTDVSGEEERDMTTTPNSGLIAQEIYYNAPELRNMVDLNTDSSGNVITPVEVDAWNENLDYDSLNWGSKAVSVNYMYLIPYLVKTIKELNARITVLEQNV